jgi:hypothetical protein
LEICGCKVVQTELIASREYKMIERAELRKEVFDGGFIRQIECVSLCISFQLLDGFLNSFRVARGDNELGPLRCRLLSDRQTDSGGPSQDDHSLVM